MNEYMYKRALIFLLLQQIVDVVRDELSRRSALAEDELRTSLERAVSAGVTQNAVSSAVASAAQKELRAQMSAVVVPAVGALGDLSVFVPAGTVGIGCVHQTVGVTVGADEQKLVG